MNPKLILLGLLSVGLFLVFTGSSFGEMTIRTMDGRTYSLPVDSRNIQSIEFTGESGAAQSLHNLAVGKSVQQSSLGYGGDPRRAVDGNPDGNYNNSSVSHTDGQNQPWWQVDLGQTSRIQTLKIWNRTDCCNDRLSKFYVLVSDRPFTSNDLNATINQPGVSNYYYDGMAGTPTEISVNRAGRYVRIQLSGSNYLSLAEVEVLGY